MKQINKKNKRAIILPETLKIIIAVLCILVLIYLAYSLYSIFIKKTKMEQAKETLKGISSMIASLEEGEEKTYLIVAPKQWYLISSENYDKSCVDCLCFVEDFIGTNFPCENIKTVIETGCGFKNACIHVFPIPLEVTIVKKNGQIRIGPTQEISNENLFNQLLDYKDRKTIKELSVDYVSGVSGADVELKSSLEKFFSNRNLHYFFTISTFPETGAFLFHPGEPPEIVVGLVVSPGIKYEKAATLIIKNNKNEEFIISLQTKEK